MAKGKASEIVLSEEERRELEVAGAAAVDRSGAGAARSHRACGG